MAAGAYTFGSFNLADNVNYAVTRAIPPAAPIDLTRQPLPARHGSVVVSDRFAENPIELSGVVKSDVSFADAESKLDALMLALSSGLQNLKLGYQDERYWRVRLLGRVTFVRRSPALYEYSAQFIAADPFAYAAASSSSAPGASLFALTP